MNRQNKVCVLGMGYIGLPTACMFASHGKQVVGVDINSTVIKTLQEGKLHIHEPGLQEVLTHAIESGNLRVSTKPEPADAFVIAVPTPFYEDKKADMRAVVSAAESIVPFLEKGNLVVLESTSPPLTTINLVAPILERSGLRVGEELLVAYSPERVLPGQILKELVENARVIGGLNPIAADAACELYKSFVEGSILLTDATTAEMVKLMENTYRDVNIAIANEFSHLADRFGVDVWEAISLANRHPRVKILNPGPGVGGHCISVDPWFFVETAPDITPLIHAAREVNDSQPHFVVDIVRRSTNGEMQGLKVAALGLAYKPDVDDLRESPAIEVVKLLKDLGAVVSAYEPFKPGYQLDGIRTCDNLAECLKDADIILLLVRHTQFQKMTPDDISNLSSARLIIDTVNAIDRKEWSQSGFRVVLLGDTKH